MRFTTFYFSGTGNTKWAAEEFHRAILENGDESQTVSIQARPKNLIATVQESDMIGIAFPVYAMNVPRIMKRFIARLNMALIAQGKRKPHNRPMHGLLSVLQ
jgi:multimeric flavodoxin WrbA